MGEVVNKVRSTFFCMSCKQGLPLYDAKAMTLYGIPHEYRECAAQGWNAVAFHCPKCTMPLYTKHPHLVKSQQKAFKRWNAKRRKKNGSQKLQPRV